MESSSEEKKAPKRAVRKKASVSRVKKEPVEKKPVQRRKTIARKKPVKSVVPDNPEIEKKVTANTVVRKAPTPIAGVKVAKSRSRKQQFIVMAVLLLGVGASAMVGILDDGQIDVYQTIEDRNERVRNNTASDKDTLNSTIVVPVQDTSSKNSNAGGLVGLGDVAVEPEPEVVVSTTTATSTSAVASSTAEIKEADTEDSVGTAPAAEDEVEVLGDDQ